MGLFWCSLSAKPLLSEGTKALYLLDFHLLPKMTVILHIVIAEQEAHLQPGQSPLRGSVLMFVTAKQATLLKGQTHLSEEGRYWNMTELHQGTVLSPAVNQPPCKPKSTFDSTSSA